MEAGSVVRWLSPRLRVVKPVSAPMESGSVVKWLLLRSSFFKPVSAPIESGSVVRWLLSRHNFTRLGRLGNMNLLISFNSGEVRPAIISTIQRLGKRCSANPIHSRENGPGNPPGNPPKCFHLNSAVRRIKFVMSKNQVHVSDITNMNSFFPMKEKISDDTSTSGDVTERRRFSIWDN